MGIDLSCDNKIFSCSYSYWHKIRTNIIKATIDYIKDKINKDKELYKNITNEHDENYIGINSNYDYYMNIINNIINVIDEDNNKKFYYVNIELQLDNTMKHFMRLMSELKNMSALNYFEIGGLFSVCNQSDCEGYYTPGNSLDICLLLDKIKPFLRKYEGYNCIYNANKLQTNCVYEVFETSHKNITKVMLC